MGNLIPKKYKHDMIFNAFIHFKDWIIEFKAPDLVKVFATAAGMVSEICLTSLKLLTGIVMLAVQTLECIRFVAMIFALLSLFYLVHNDSILQKIELIKNPHDAWEFLANVMIGKWVSLMSCFVVAHFSAAMRISQNENACAKIALVIILFVAIPITILNVLNTYFWSAAFTVAIATLFIFVGCFRANETNWNLQRYIPRMYFAPNPKDTLCVWPNINHQTIITPKRRATLAMAFCLWIWWSAMANKQAFELNRASQESSYTWRTLLPLWLSAVLFGTLMSALLIVSFLVFFLPNDQPHSRTVTSFFNNSSNILKNQWIELTSRPKMISRESFELLLFIFLAVTAIMRPIISSDIVWKLLDFAFTFAISVILYVRLIVPLQSTSREQYFQAVRVCMGLLVIFLVVLFAFYCFAHPRYGFKTSTIVSEFDWKRLPYFSYYFFIAITAQSITFTYLKKLLIS